MNLHTITPSIVICIFLAFTIHSHADEPWTRHTVDNSLEGADGVRLGDFNGDGLQDIVTGWEESGIVRLYLNPGTNKSAQRWPAVTVGLGKSPEDAVPFDIDGDGQLEIISCHEGKQKQVLVHRCVGVEDATLLNSANWKTTAITSLDGQQWMYATPMSLSDDRRALVLGSKNNKASLTLLAPTKDSKQDVGEWKPFKLRDCGWIMSIQVMDMDNDGDDDVVFSDRKSSGRGIGWLEQPDDSTKPWPDHTLGATDTEPMFIDATPQRLLTPTRNNNWIELNRSKDGSWSKTIHENPTDVPFGKAIRRLHNGSMILTANTNADNSSTDQPGIWIKEKGLRWKPIGTTLETKFDRIELIDLDGDGDLDVLTCEERQQLGIVWYENPEK